MSILAWLSVVLLPTIVVPTTLTFTLSSKPKEIVDGLDKLGIVNRKEKKEITTLAPTRVATGSLPPSSGSGKTSPPAKPPASPPPPGGQQQQQQRAQDQTDQDAGGKGDQNGSESGDAQGGQDNAGQTGEPGPEGEPQGAENVIPIDAILRDAAQRIDLVTPLITGGKGDILQAFEVSSALSRFLSVVEDLAKKSQGSPAA